MKHYRKLVVAVIGLGLMLLSRHAGIDLTGQEQLITDAALAILTAAGVERFANEPKEKKE